MASGPPSTVSIWPRTPSSFGRDDDTAGTTMLGRARAGTGAVMLGAKASVGVAPRAGRVGLASIAADAMRSAGMMASAISTARVVANAIWTADLVAMNAPGITRGWGPAPRVAAAQASDMLPRAEAPNLPAAAQAASMVAEVA